MTFPQLHAIYAGADDDGEIEVTHGAQIQAILDAERAEEDRIVAAIEKGVIT